MIVDIETTGLTPGFDRVVEISVIRKEPGAEPEHVLDTLVNPRRRMAATEIHGITDDDVAKAPTFEDIAGDVVATLSDSVVTAYNVYFDVPFVEFELRQAGIEASPPHLCLMYLRPMLGLGKRCSLGEACRAHGIEHESTHVAAGDARAGSRLLGLYLDEIRSRGIRTFGELGRLKAYKFVDSFQRDPLSVTRCRKPRSGRFQSRSGLDGRSMPGRPAPSAKAAGTAPSRALGLYWEALTAALADLDVTEEEVVDLQSQERDLGLQSEQVRALHARAFAGAISHLTGDRWIDEQDRDRLSRLYRCLSRLGWAPGE